MVEKQEALYWRSVAEFRVEGARGWMKNRIGRTLPGPSSSPPLLPPSVSLIPGDCYIWMRRVGLRQREERERERAQRTRPAQTKRNGTERNGMLCVFCGRGCQGIGIRTHRLKAFAEDQSHSALFLTLRGIQTSALRGKKATHAIAVDVCAPPKRIVLVILSLYARSRAVYSQTYTCFSVFPTILRKIEILTEFNNIKLNEKY